jgi:hypothetical protein
MYNPNHYKIIELEINNDDVHNKCRITKIERVFDHKKSSGKNVYNYYTFYTLPLGVTTIDYDQNGKYDEDKDKVDNVKIRPLLDYLIRAYYYHQKQNQNKDDNISLLSFDIKIIRKVIFCLSRLKPWNKKIYNLTLSSLLSGFKSFDFVQAIKEHDSNNFLFQNHLILDSIDYNRILTIITTLVFDHIISTAISIPIKAFDNHENGDVYYICPEQQEENNYDNKTNHKDKERNNNQERKHAKYNFRPLHKKVISNEDDNSDSSSNDDDNDSDNNNNNNNNNNDQVDDDDVKDDDNNDNNDDEDNNDQDKDHDNDDEDNNDNKDQDDNDDDNSYEDDNPQQKLKRRRYNRFTHRKQYQYSSSSSYPQDKATTNSIKFKINESYVAASKMISEKNNDSAIIYLDASQLHTSNQFLDVELSNKVKLVVVNKGDDSKMLKKNLYKNKKLLERVEYHNSFIGECIDKMAQRKQKIASIWLDYTGGLYGSYIYSVKDDDYTPPCEDIMKFFQNLKDLICDGAVFSITLCRRNCGKDLKTGNNLDIRQEVVKLIDREAINAGFIPRSEEIIDYGTMIYRRYTLEKIKKDGDDNNNKIQLLQLEVKNLKTQISEFKEFKQSYIDTINHAFQHKINQLEIKYDQQFQEKEKEIETKLSLSTFVPNDNHNINKNKNNVINSKPITTRSTRSTRSSKCEHTTPRTRRKSNSIAQAIKSSYSRKRKRVIN